MKSESKGWALTQGWVFEWLQKVNNIDQRFKSPSLGLCKIDTCVVVKGYFTYFMLYISNLFTVAFPGISHILLCFLFTEKHKIDSWEVMQEWHFMAAFLFRSLVSSI